MTDREIQTALLAYYKANLAAMPVDSFDNAYSFLSEKKMCDGVCACASKVFVKTISNALWVEKYCPKGSCYWGPPPFYFYLKRRLDLLTQSIEHRICILEKILTVPA